MRVALLLTVVALSLEPQPSSESKEQRLATQRGSDSLPVSVKLLTTGKSVQEIEQEDRRAAEAAQINRRQLAANVIIASFASLSFLLSLWTLHHTRQTARQQLRAYLLLDEAFVADKENAPPFPLPAPYRIEFKNTGATPAHNVSVFWNYRIRPLDYDFRVGSGIGKPTRLTVGPGHVITVFADPPEIEEREKAALEAGSLTVYVFGTVLYTDAFGKKHFSNFRYVRQPEKGHLLEVYPAGNESD